MTLKVARVGEARALRQGGGADLLHSGIATLARLDEVRRPVAELRAIERAPTGAAKPK